LKAYVLALAPSDLGIIEHPELQRLAEFWLSARDGRLAPAVSAIDPTQFKPLLPSIWICEVNEDDPEGRFRYRLTGQDIRTSDGANPTGKTLTQITDSSAWARVIGYFDVAADKPAIIHVVGQLFAESDNRAKGERLMLPFFSNTEDRVVRLLGATIRFWDFERGESTAEIPDHQIRTFLPVDGSKAWSEDWL
jgi:hypothetical protein